MVTHVGEQISKEKGVSRFVFKTGGYVCMFLSKREAVYSYHCNKILRLILQEYCGHKVISIDLPLFGEYGDHLILLLFLEAAVLHHVL